MKDDPHLGRFMSYLTLFTFFMLVLVTSGNYMQLFLGWEGVGLASYLLINFWHTRLQANKSALKAIMVNRIGDFFFFFGIVAVFFVFNAVDFQTIFSMLPYVSSYNFNFFFFEINALTFISVFFFLGAVGKSAQLGLHTWLPDAMEGPTPVSALIHAATMVTAGVFLILRSSPIFEYSNFALNFMLIIGATTALLGGSIGLFQNDLKKVIAYSTCSQLGYMVLACGLSSYNVSMYHLVNHAFFKALLFLTAGCVIHSMSNDQDMRKMGGLINLLPLSYIMILVGSLSLMGFPFLTGFYSKDAILEVAYSSYSSIGFYAYFCGTLTAFITAFYSSRLLYLTFLSYPNAYKNYIEHVHESPLNMVIPLVVLSFFSIFIGYIFKDMFIGAGSSFWGISLFINPSLTLLTVSEFIPSFIKLIPVFFSLLGAISSLIIYVYFYPQLIALQFQNFSLKFYSFFNKKWYFDLLYNNFLVLPFLKFSYTNVFKKIDRGFFEHVGPSGLSNYVSNLSNFVSKAHSGLIYNYALFFVLFLVFFTCIVLAYFYNFSFDLRLGAIFIYLVLSLRLSTNSFNFFLKFR
jgi:NADH-ubiquinone oxidoreductase chain 5